jgi:hypothetical protein
MLQFQLPDQHPSFASLTERQQLYFRVMWTRNGVLYIQSKPGIAKSAISRTIAEKMGFHYLDLRLSMLDETDVGLYPSVDTVDGVKCLDFVVPRWAIEANKRPTIVHFEEMNRASLQVRNAALQILLERSIGVNFKFNDNVLMMSSGNLGDEDGTDVEEFDNALNNRLVHIKHTLSAQEWYEDFAKDNVHPIVTSYIKAYPEKLYQDPNENTKAYATPRSWTFLSDFIIKNFGKDASPRVFLPVLQQVAHGFIGNGAQRFMQYCQDMVNISIRDVLDRYDEVKKDLAKYNRDKNSELLQSLKTKEFAIDKLTDKQRANLASFLKTISDDELTSYLLYVVDDPNFDPKDETYKTFLLNFADILKVILSINDPKKKKK